MSRIPSAGIRWYQLSGALKFRGEALSTQAEAALRAFQDACRGRAIIREAGPVVREVYIADSMLPEQITRIRKTLPPLLRLVAEPCELEESNAGHARWIQLVPNAPELASSRLPSALRSSAPDPRLSA